MWYFLLSLSGKINPKQISFRMSLNKTNLTTYSIYVTQCVNKKAQMTDQDWLEKQLAIVTHLVECQCPANSSIASANGRTSRASINDFITQIYFTKWHSNLYLKFQSNATDVLLGVALDFLKLYL